MMNQMNRGWGVTATTRVVVPFPWRKRLPSVSWEA
jgi:hypothetical protein